MKNVKKFNFIYLLSFLGDALFSPFIALYFISISFDDYQRGVLLALIPISTIIGNFIYGKISGKLNKNINILRILTLINTIIFSLYGFIDNFYALIILTILFGLHNSPYFSMQDGISVNFCEQEKKIYSNTRMFGSLGYCLALIGGYFIVDFIEYKYIFLIGGALFVIVNIILLFVKTNKENDLVIEKKEVSFKELFKNKVFIRYVIFYLLLIGIWTIGESYVSTYFNSLEIKDSYYSLMFGAQVGIETIVILLLGKLIKDRKKLKYVLIVSSIVIALRYLLMGTYIPVNILLIISALTRGIGWGGFLFSHLALTKKILGIDLTTKGITFLAIITNLLGTIGNFVSPYIYNNLSLQWLYLIFGIIQVIGVIVLFGVNFNKEERIKE